MAQALLVVDHGSRAPEADRVVAEVAKLLRRSRPGLVVHVAHLYGAPPTVEEGFAKCAADGATAVIVHPFLLAPGRHALEDLPRLAAQAAAKFPHIIFRVTPPLGAHEKLAEVVLERAGLA